MQTEAERIFYRRLYILIGLTAAMVCGLFYLMYLTVVKERTTVSAETRFTKVQKAVEIVYDSDKKILIPTADVIVPDDNKPADQPAKPDEEKKPETETADVTTNSSLLRIVSPAAKIDPGYVPDRLVVPDVPMYQVQELRPEAASALEEMFAAAAQDGYDLYLISGFRSYDYQVGLWNYYVDYFGLSYTEHIDAHPGGSEHQLGLSVDIGTTDDVCRLDTCFGGTGAFAWLQANSYKYGYIERYPQDKEAITGIMYSPWSFRYTGRQEAEKLYQTSLTMEEYYHMN